MEGRFTGFHLGRNLPFQGLGVSRDHYPPIRMEDVNCEVELFLTSRAEFIVTRRQINHCSETFFDPVNGLLINVVGIGDDDYSPILLWLFIDLERSALDLLILEIKRTEIPLRAAVSFGPYRTVGISTLPICRTVAKENQNVTHSQKGLSDAYSHA
jgi:hypothetical protein